MEKNIIRELNKYFDAGINSEEERLPDIEQANGIISAYDLLRYLNKEFSDIKGLKTEAKELLDSMKEYSNKLTLKRIFNPNDGIIRKCERMAIEYHKTGPRINFFRGAPFYSIAMEIFKNKQNNLEAYVFTDVEICPLESEADIECIEVHEVELKRLIDKAQYIYNVYEDPYNLCYGFKKNIINRIERIEQNLNVSNGLFEFTVEGDFERGYSEKTFVPNVCLKYLRNHDAIKNKYNLTDTETHTIINMILYNQEEILRKIPVKISELHPEIQGIVNHHINEVKRIARTKSKTTKQKPLTRKRTKSKRH